MKRLRLIWIATLVCTVLCCATSRAVDEADWSKPFPPFRIAGNLYYVGSADLAAYLVVTPKGDILINSNLKTSAPLIQASVEKLGFRMSDIRIVLQSHAHFDHAGGSAAIQKLTGAQVMVMDAGVPVMEAGGVGDFGIGDGDPAGNFPPVHVDRVLHDGERLEFGGSVLTAHKTAGHTQGCTTWSMTVTENGEPFHVVIVCSASVLPSYNLVNSAAYPQQAKDYAATFRTLRALPCDIFLASHGEFFGLKQKYARMQTEGFHAWIDPAGYKEYVSESERKFQRALARQQRRKQ